MVSLEAHGRCGRHVPQMHNGVLLSHKEGSICGEMGVTGSRCIKGNESDSGR